MPRKKVLDEEPEEGIYEWDKLRIILFFVVILILLAGGILAKHFFLDANIGPSGALQSVKGIAAQNDSSQLPTVQSVQEGVQQQISNLQQQASQISIEDIASSSQQVKQILQQLKDLPNVPGNTLKQTCTQICNNL